MKKTLILSLLLALGFCYQTIAQKTKSQKLYKLAETVQPEDYEHGKIIIKFKPEAKNAMQAPTNEALILQSALQKIGGTNYNTLFKDAHLQQENGGRVDNFRKPVVDLTLFFEAKYDTKKMDIETAITQLYATGMIEYAEPSFIKKSFYTPSDTQISSQYYLDNIGAYKAWDTSKGDSSIVIAIVDSGVQLNHPDLRNKIKYNLADPINGVDDDKDGFVDNSRGWDYAGADYENLKSDNDPNITGDNNTHGTAVGGCAAADTDNKLGIAGVGFNCKILPIKHAADNDTRGPGGSNAGLYGTFLGVLYAANHGASIINCSYGSNDYSQTEQDVINYATIEKGCLVVAAAGNSGTLEASFPASYNYVLSIGSTDRTDTKSGFSTFHHTVDLSSPGSSIFTTHFDGAYRSTQGTSFSSPIVAGAAGLLKSINKNFTGLQIGELLRVTSDDIIKVSGSAQVEEMGRGRLNMQRAIAEKPYSVKLLKYDIVNATGALAQAGDTATLTGDFLNYLYPTSANFKVSLSSNNSAVQVLRSDATLGVINMMQTKNSKSTPFRIAIQRDVAKDTEVILRLDYDDNGVKDRQFITVKLNPSYYIINKNSMTTSIGSIGRIGYEDTRNQQGGVGFIYNGNPMLYELGLMLGVSEAQVPNTVRGVGTAIGNDFQPVNFVSEVNPTKISTYDLQGIFNDNLAGTRKVGVTVNYKSFVWEGVPNDKYFIVEYTIRNTRTDSIKNLSVGMFADWDVSENGAEDKANWDNETRLGYIHHTAATGLYGGIQLLNRNLKPNYYAIDNDDDANIGVYSSNTDKGFTDAEKFKSMSSGLTKTTAGDKTAKGQDVSHVVAAGGINIAPNDSIKVAFAFMGGDNLADLKNSAKAADIKYNQTLKAAQPVSADQFVCYNNSATLTATGAGKYKWYNSIAGGTLLSTTNTYTTSRLTADTAVFVANADQPFESVRTRVNVRLAANPQIRLNGSTQLCPGEKLTLTAGRGNSYLWSNGSTSQSIVVDKAGTYSVTVRSTNPTCVATSELVTVSVDAVTAKFAASLTTIDFKDNMEISLTDQSTNAVSYFWEFGNGTTSREKNPKIKYTKAGDFTIKLTVTSAAGCTSSSTQKITVTSVADEIFSSQITLFPNPTQNNVTLLLDNEIVGKVNVKCYNLIGALIMEESFEKNSTRVNKTLDISTLPAGMYILHVSNGEAKAVKKLVITK